MYKKGGGTTDRLDGCLVGLSFFLFFRGWTLVFVSPFSAGSSVVCWLATSAYLPFTPLFPFICTFLSDALSFPAAFFGFASTLAGAGLADSLAERRLGSALAAPSALTFLLGIVAARGGRRVRRRICHRGAALPSRRRRRHHHANCCDPSWGRWENRMEPDSKMYFLKVLLFLTSISGR